MTMTEHTAFCSQFARRFGDDTFDPLWLKDKVLYVFANYDWCRDSFDENPLLDPNSRQPLITARTPPRDSVLGVKH